MDFEKRWKKIDELGGGGQGMVYRVMDRKIADIEGKINPTIDDTIWKLSKTQPTKVRLAAASKFSDLIIGLIR